MEGNASGKPRGRRPAHYFTFFDAGFNATIDLSVFEATVLPAQYWDLRKPLDRPEHALSLAVLEQAVREFQRGFFSESKRTRRLAREAAAWFLSTDDSWLFSFEKVCETLDIEPSYLRNGLIQMGKMLAEKRKKGELTQADQLKIRPLVVSKNMVTSPSLQYIDKLPRADAKF